MVGLVVEEVAVVVPQVFLTQMLVVTLLSLVAVVVEVVPLPGGGQSGGTGGFFSAYSNSDAISTDILDGDDAGVQLRNLVVVAAVAAAVAASRNGGGVEPVVHGMRWWCKV